MTVSTSPDSLSAAPGQGNISASPRVNYHPVRALAHEAWRQAGMTRGMRSLRYIDELLSLRCVPDLLAAGLFPERTAAKEMTESGAAFNAVRSHLPWAKAAKDVTVVCVGDGAAPRTAALFAFRTRWQVHSIDPVMRLRNYGIRALTLHRAKAKDVRIRARSAIIVAVHSHCSFEEAVSCVDADRVAYVCIPCCTPLALATWPADEVYRDPGILSPDDSVYVWHDVLGRGAS